MNEVSINGYVVFALALLVLAVAIVWLGVKIVPQGHHWTVERFGRYTRTLKPGLTLIVPFIDTIGRKISVMETVLTIDPRDIISADNVLVTADAVIYYRVDDAAKAAYEVEHLEPALVNLAVTNLRSVLGSMELDAMLSNREDMNKKLQASIDDATTSWGVKVTRIEISELQLSEELQNAMNLQMTAERERRAAVTRATAVREAAVLEATGQKEATELKAEGDKNAAFQAAEARERQAAAEAKAVKEVAAAISESGHVAAQYWIAQGYIAKFGDIAASDNSKLIMMPVEATSMTSAVAGLAELLADTRGSK